MRFKAFTLLKNLNSLPREGEVCEAFAEEDRQLKVRVRGREQFPLPTTARIGEGGRRVPTVGAEEYSSLRVCSRRKQELVWHKRRGPSFQRSLKRNEEAGSRKATMGLISSFG